MGFLLRQLEDTVESGILNNMNIKKECKGDYQNAGTDPGFQAGGGRR